MRKGINVGCVKGVVSSINGLRRTDGFADAMPNLIGAVVFAAIPSVVQTSFPNTKRPLMLLIKFLSYVKAIDFVYGATQEL